MLLTLWFSLLTYSLIFCGRRKHVRGCDVYSKQQVVSFLSQVCTLSTSWPALEWREAGWGLAVSEAAPAVGSRSGDGRGHDALVGAACWELHRLGRRNFSAFQPHTRAGALGHTDYTACITDHCSLSAPASATTAAAGFCIWEFCS